MVHVHGNVVDSFCSYANACAYPGEKRHNGVARVAANHGHVDLVDVQAGLLSDEGVGAENVEGRHTEDALGIELASLLHGLAEDGNGRVHRVGDDTNQSPGARAARQ